ncbi:MAG: ribose-phosphate pyrophosphokinase, partial [Lachnospiraceae bacterium]|nr:ribose-phosphate pyrophosphokinase [Lachnospiraceae bacterium]
TYQKPELLEREYYYSVDLSKYIALLIDSLNHDNSISDLLLPTDRINRILERHRERQKEL